MNLQQRLRTLFDNLRTTLWFQPALGAILGAILAAVFSEFDRARGFLELPLFRIGVEGSQAVLVAIATGMLTIVGLVFRFSWWRWCLLHNNFPRASCATLSATGLRRM